jgi:hypothetical protein
MNDFSRRKWLKGMALASLGSVVFYDLQAENELAGISKASFDLSNEEESMLSVCMDTILPESNIPGAISLGAPVFVKTMLKDCYENKAQLAIKQFLGSFGKDFQGIYSKSIQQASVAEKEQFLFQVAKGKMGENAQKALETIKGLTIQGFLTSEKIMTEQLNYVMAPGFFNGCATIKK